MTTITFHSAQGRLDGFVVEGTAATPRPVQTLSALPFPPP